VSAIDHVPSAGVAGFVTPRRRREKSSTAFAREARVSCQWVEAVVMLIVDIVKVFLN
jgi:hypothetical protein